MRTKVQKTVGVYERPRQSKTVWIVAGLIIAIVVVTLILAWSAAID